MSSSKAWTEANQEKVREYSRRYYHKNKAKWQTPEAREAHRLRGKAYAKKRTPEQRELRNAKARKSYAANREKNLARGKKWYLEHLEQKRAYDKKRHKENRLARPDEARAKYEQQRHWWQAYYQARKEKVRLQGMAWRKANPDKREASRHKRLARLKDGRSLGVTPVEWRTILEQFGNLCAYCRKPNGSKRLERDHVIPLSKGGLDNPDNVVPACRSCNLRKAARLDWTP